VSVTAMRDEEFWVGSVKRAGTKLSGDATLRNSA
jgi:hypothetical protein